MPLFDIAQETLERLKKAESARTGVAETQALESLLKEFAASALRINQLVGRAKLLHGEGVCLSPIPEVAQAIKALSNVATRFHEVPKSTTLRQGQRWTSLIERLEGLETNVGSVQAKDWSAFFNSHLFGGARPEQVRALLAPTPENEKALKIYAELFHKFVRYRSQLPKDAEEFKVLRACSDQLGTIKFQEKVPEDVRQFFEATASNTGASLDLLTSEVIEWLRDNDLLGSYTVRARIN